MKTTHKRIKIRDLVEGFADNGTKGVTGYGGKLDIRPKYQREFVYKVEQQKAVINTVMNKFPLNIMYWNDNGNDTYEIIDGQQRTLSICHYYMDKFGYNYNGNVCSYTNLPSDIKEKFLEYEIDVYICTGTESEKLEWFKTINIAGEPLTEQELRNAVYSGSWVNNAKDKFSNPLGYIATTASKYISFTGSAEDFAIRQGFLELALKWIGQKQNISIDKYMSVHQHDGNANELSEYFGNIVKWIENIFPEYHKTMKRNDWNVLYEANKDRTDLNPEKLQEEIEELRADYDVKNSKGIYDYVLSDHSKKAEKYLNIRDFSKRDREIIYARQNGICPICNEHFDIKDMDADHITPWSKGGKTVVENCQMLCKSCNRTKSDK